MNSKPNPIIIPDIINIICTYVEPYSLINFFDTHDINLNTRFKYNAYPHELTISSINLAFTKFSNIILTNLSVIIDDDNIISHLSLNHLTNLKITSKERRSLIHHFFDECYNLRSLTIERMKLYDLEFLTKYKKLKFIKFISCYWRDLTNINVLSHLPNLCAVNFGGCDMTPHDLEVLSQCPNLKTLTMSNKWSPSATIKLPTLKRLTIIKFKGLPIPLNTIYLSMFNECPNLQILKIKNIDSTINIQPIQYNLRKLIITSCNIRNETILNTLNIRHLHISNCTYEDEDENGHCG